MSSRRKGRRKKESVKNIYWVCDKCDTGNKREIPTGSVLNDDVCDYCHKRIHEPLTLDLKHDDKH